MPCCGNKRAALAANASYTRVHQNLYSPAIPTQEISSKTEPNPLIALRFLGQGSLSMVGARTGKIYTFTDSNPVSAVQQQDSPAFLRTGMFQPQAES